MTELKLFLDVINYYYRHLQNFSNCLEPLHALLRKWKWEWTEIEKNASDNAKELSISPNLWLSFRPVVKHGNAYSMSRLSLQSDNIEQGSALEKQVLITELCNSPVTSPVTLLNILVGVR